MFKVMANPLELIQILFGSFEEERRLLFRFLRKLKLTFLIRPLNSWLNFFPGNFQPIFLKYSWFHSSLSWPKLPSYFKLNLPILTRLNKLPFPKRARNYRGFHQLFRKALLLIIGLP